MDTDLKQQILQLQEALRKERTTRQALESQLETLQKALTQHPPRKLLTHIGHELRTPLNGILGYAQILQQDTSLDQTQQEGLRVIRQGAEQLLNLLDNIMDWSKIEVDALSLQSVPFDLAYLLKEVVGITHQRAQHKSLSFTYQPYDFRHQQPLTNLSYTVQGDEKRLRQTLLNLLNYALHTPKVKQLIFRVGPVDDQHMRFSVLPAPNIHPDFNAIPHHATLNWSDTTSLTLSISEKLIRMMAGTLEISADNLFQFQIPLPIISQPPHDANKMLVGVDGTAWTVLVADDDWTNRNVLIKMLEPHGFTIIAAQDGNEAWHKALTYTPQLVLVDLVMPDMDGLALTRLLRQDPKTQAAVIIAISASALDDDYQASLEVGCNAFLSKPIQKTMLLEQLHHIAGVSPVYQSADTEATSQIVPPPPADIDRLLKLAIIGDVAEIQAQAANLESNYKPFADEISRLARSFQVNRLCEFLEGHLT